MSQSFIHLHVHSHYSVLDGMSKVPDLVDKCRANGMHAMALTDHGNMFGIKELTDYANKVNGASKKKLKELQKKLGEAAAPAERTELEAEIEQLKEKMAGEIPFKPIIGIEAYCARRSLSLKDKNIKAVNAETGREFIVDRSGYHLILLAKNKRGYLNLCKLSSIAFTEGFYDRPRIDKQILEKYHDGIIACSACLGGEIPQLIMAGKIDEAEQSINWFKSIFGDDYYLEIQRHKTDKPNADTHVYERQKQVIPVIVDLAQRTNTKIIATNDVHFVEEEHGEAHDRLICLSTSKDLDDPSRMRYTKQEWLKTPDEMAAIFADMPEVLTNTLEIADKVETYSIESGPIMPMFDIPKDFGTEEEYRQKYTEEDLFNEFTRNEKGEVVMSPEDAEAKIKKLGGYDKLYRVKLEADYLSKLAWEGAHVRYGETLTEEQTERIEFELHIMKTMGFPGYFLIVQDYIRAAREVLSVSVGPGRGSAAGSVVAYCLKITDIDPLKYDLLFERFLNPDRISLPDIDVDFDDDGRGAVLDWVTNKYGKERVAHIITYGTMATKSSIADVGRVQNVPLSIVNQFKSFVPDKFDDVINPETGKTFAEGKGKPPKVKLKNCFKYVKELHDARYCDDENISSMLEYAEQLEDTIRQIGIHACGVIIGADDLTNFAPLCTVKDRVTDQDVLVTQYDGHVIESVGLIKMDFLGLSTLSIIKEALKNIKHTTGQDINIDAIPIDDELTFQLFSEGRTVGTFQFESPGMQKYLRELKPTVFEDLIAMNALYRPGPIEYIPQFIRRKHGEEEIKYDIPVMEKYLKDTYGVTVYQEQVMLLSRLLGGFTRGQSDALRKAMGKKIIAILNELKPKFIEGGQANGYDPAVLDKIWRDWEAFASYAFNKSHATCYAWVAYQTAYLKAHYPSEYMAGLLTRSKDDIKEVTKFMEECKSMKINVKGPNVNESELNFAVNKQGDILFGLGGVKGVGQSAVEAIVREREKNGNYRSIYDFMERVDLSACNRKAIESLAYAGAFDTLGDIRREQFFALTNGGDSGSETLVRYGSRYQADREATQNSLFGDAFGEIEITKPALPNVTNPWSALERLNYERDVVGIYLTSHPLDEYRFEIKYMANAQLKEIDELDDEAMSRNVGRTYVVCGIVTGAREGTTRKGSPYMIAKLEDMSGACEFALFGNDYAAYNGFFRQMNAYVSITLSLERDRFNASKIRKNIRKVCYMADMLKPGALRSVTFTMDIAAVTPEFIEDLDTVLKENKPRQNAPAQRAEEQRRTVPVRLRLVDRAHNYDVRLATNEFSVEIGRDLLNFVDNVEGLQMTIDQ